MDRDQARQNPTVADENGLSRALSDMLVDYLPVYPHTQYNKLIQVDKLVPSINYYLLLQDTIYKKIHKGYQKCNTANIIMNERDKQQRDKTKFTNVL